MREALLKHDPEVLVLWREAMKGQGKRNDLCSNPTEVKTERGRSYTVSRLQREAPELFAQVGVNLPESLALTPFTGPHL